MPLAPPMMVRNTYRGPLVFSPDGEANNYIEFAGAGDPDGKDVQIVPGELANSVQFRRNLNLGLITIEEEQVSIDTALTASRGEWERRQADMATSAMASIEQTADNDMLMKECIGPGTKSGENCGVPIPIRTDALAVQAPVCQAHKHLEGQFVPQKTGRLVANRDEVIWVRAGSQVPSTSTTT